MKVYVAGPMTGLPDHNYPAFRAAAFFLSKLGHQVEDPSTNVNPTPSDYHGWLRAGLAQLITCEGVALLDGWEASGGARLEVNVAATLGLRVSPLAEWLREPTRAWRDRHGVVWRLGDDGLMHSRATAPFSREHVEGWWGPLVAVPKGSGS